MSKKPKTSEATASQSPVVPLPPPSAPHIIQRRGFGIVWKQWLEWPDGRKEPYPRRISD